jgi:hypothetical protein
MIARAMKTRSRGSPFERSPNASLPERNQLTFCIGGCFHLPSSASGFGQ